MTSESTESGEGGPRVQVISRVGQILRVLAPEPEGLSLAEVVNRTGLPKSTVYRLLQALDGEELVRAKDGRFHLGPSLAGPSRPELLGQRLLPLMQRLAVSVQETVDLGVLAGDQIRFVEQVRWQRELSVGAILGELYPALASACGKALLAASPEHQSAALASTDLDSARRIALKAELHAASEHKLAFDREGFHPGIAGIATYVRARDGSPVALGIVVSSAGFEARRDELSRALLALRPELQTIAAAV